MLCTVQLLSRTWSSSIRGVFMSMSYTLPTHAIVREFYGRWSNGHLPVKKRYGREKGYGPPCPFGVLSSVL